MDPETLSLADVTFDNADALDATPVDGELKNIMDNLPALKDDITQL